MAAGERDDIAYVKMHDDDDDDEDRCGNTTTTTTSTYYLIAYTIVIAYYNREINNHVWAALIVGFIDRTVDVKVGLQPTQY